MVAASLNLSDFIHLTTGSCLLFYYFTLLKFVVETLMQSISQVADVETSGNLYAVLAASGSQFTNALVNAECGYLSFMC